MPIRTTALMPAIAAASDNNLIVDYFRVSADRRLLFGAGETFSARPPRNPFQRAPCCLPVALRQRTVPAGSPKATSSRR
ncbi:hypothetical protein [Cupriavidus pinatubonensis]|uniref:Uncharacterized protein n=1 Tax=Cupriavidus pinatubonensis TaxID=248026 RepID=A0ABM8WI52_9BURK|nr:hypothetical protein [Cupriavidus pinatubonensis]CAG9167073.1 hypothetical protein LMG23994_01092 [Cupriavidus pinatubonensis]